MISDKEHNHSHKPHYIYNLKRVKFSRESENPSVRILTANTISRIRGPKGSDRLTPTPYR